MTALSASVVADNARVDREPADESIGAVRDFFDALGAAEWDRLVESPRARVALELHRRFLRRFVQPGWRVLEVGAGPGRFTVELARAGTSVVVSDISGFPLSRAACSPHRPRTPSRWAILRRWSGWPPIRSCGHGCWTGRKSWPRNRECSTAARTSCSRSRRYGTLPRPQPKVTRATVNKLGARRHKGPSGGPATAISLSATGPESAIGNVASWRFITL